MFGFDECNDVFEALYSHPVIKADIDRMDFAEEFKLMNLDKKKDARRFFNTYMCFRPTTYTIKGIFADRAARDELIARGVTSDDATQKTYHFFDSMCDLISVEDVDEERILNCVKLAVKTLV